MNDIGIELRLSRVSERHVALGGHGLTMVMNPGRWVVTSGGGRPRIIARGVTASDAFHDAEMQVAALEATAVSVGRTLGISQ